MHITGAIAQKNRIYSVSLLKSESKIDNICTCVNLYQQILFAWDKLKKLFFKKGKIYAKYIKKVLTAVLTAKTFSKNVY